MGPLDILMKYSALSDIPKWEYMLAQTYESIISYFLRNSDWGLPSEIMYHFPNIYVFTAEVWK